MELEQELERKVIEHNFIATEILSLASRRFRKFPDWILEHEEVLILNLSFNQIPSIPNLSIYMFNLAVLNLSNNQIQQLPPDICNLITLKQLYISNNQLLILPSKIGKLVNLEKLEIIKNYLVKLPPSFGSLKSLKDLDLSHNRLVHLPASCTGLENLQTIILNFNKLKTLPRMISNISNLKTLKCSDNKIRTLPEDLFNLVNLEHLDISINRIWELSNNISELINLRTLDISRNHLSIIPSGINRLHQIYKIDISGNPLEHIPPQVIRLLNTRIQINNSIYGDNQNIHNHDVQQSVIKSIENIMNIPRRENCMSLETVINQVAACPILTSKTKEALLEYMDDKSVHTILNITFEELFLAVWNMYILLDENEMQSHERIINSLLDRLNQEMLDSECKCFTGRITRLINTLSGYTPLVNIEIADNEQIAIIIKKVQERLESMNGYTVNIHRELVSKELLERCYSPDTIKTWVNGIE